MIEDSLAQLDPTLDAEFSGLSKVGIVAPLSDRNFDLGPSDAEISRITLTQRPLRFHDAYYPAAA